MIICLVQNLIIHINFVLLRQVFVVEDCCADRSREHHEGVLRIYDGYHIKVVRLAELSFATKSS